MRSVKRQKKIEIKPIKYIVTDLHARQKKLIKKREQKLIKSSVERKDKLQNRSS
jgi:hypothetical protein